MVQFESDEIDLGRGRSSAQLEANRLLAPLAQHPVVHRDDLMVF
jgi:glutamate 5-kinase